MLLQLGIAVSLVLPRLVLGDDVVIAAISPRCTTDTTGSTSCNVGVNPVPTFQSLDGGYQWLSAELITETDSRGVIKTTTSRSWTAVETNFLTASVSTKTNGADTITTTTTSYVSFITAQPTVNGNVGDAVIAGVVLAPAIVAAVQAVTDGAAGMTVEEVASRLSSALELKKVTLTAGDLQRLSNFILNAVALVAAGEVASAVVSAYWTGPTAPVAVTATITSGGDGGSVTTTSEVPTVTAIVKVPYDNWQAIFNAAFVPEQLPDENAERPESEQVCTPHADKNVAFRREWAVETIDKICTTGQSSFPMYDQDTTLPDVGKFKSIGTSWYDVLIWTKVGFSANQAGCKKGKDNKLSQDDCKHWFKAAVDNCDTGTTDEKFGAKPLTWSSPNGCIEFSIWAVL